MGKKISVTLIVLYLLGVIGVTVGGLSTNWDDDWPIHQQIDDAMKMGFGWPIAVAELLVSD